LIVYIIIAIRIIIMIIVILSKVAKHLFCKSRLAKKNNALLSKFIRHLFLTSMKPFYVISSLIVWQTSFNSLSPYVSSIKYIFYFSKLLTVNSRLKLGIKFYKTLVTLFNFLNNDWLRLLTIVKLAPSTKTLQFSSFQWVVFTIIIFITKAVID
jgi:hypothetical protein